LDVAGRTIAVLGSGLDVIYPACNRPLAEQLTQNGALVSEYPPGTRPMAINFPRRNRIISGLSMGTLVVEATLSSGSLITASLALEQGREVFAVPGSIHNPLSQGCHRLIRDGAKLVEIVDDILEEISPIQSALIPPRCVQPRSGNIPEALDADGKLLLHNIGMQPVGVDTLVQETGLSVGAITASLLILELGGFVEQLPGGEYRRC
jgi:DNA processing protein